MVGGIVRPGTYKIVGMEVTVHRNPWNAEYLKKFY